MGRISVIWLCVTLFVPCFAQAQVNRYMVFFHDKVGTPFNTGNPSAFLSAKAIERRMEQGITISEMDLPVTPTYVDDVQNTGATVLYTTKWMNGVLVQCDASLVSTLEALTPVQSVELVAPGSRPVNGGRRRSVKSKMDTDDDETTPQLSMLGMDAMHADGFRGEGVSIAVFDGGFQGGDSALPFSHVLTENRIELVHDFVYGGVDVFAHDDHGTEVWSVIGAFQDGTFTGGAYKANFQLYITEDVPSEYRVEEYNWLFAAERSDSAGVDIINSSLGYNTFDDASMDYSPSDMDGVTAVVTRAAQLAADRGIIVVSSAGNSGSSGWQIVTAPADAADLLAIGNVNLSGIKSPTSSVGPTADGRIKPDVVALGTSVKVIEAAGTVGTASGTSLASPLVASLVAGLWQKYPDLTNKELMDAIRFSASQASTPDNLLGYGIPNYLAASNYIENTSQTDLIVVYPNPVTQDSITIKPVSPDEIQDAFVSILNINGQTLGNYDLTFSWVNSRWTFSLSPYPTGIYFLRVRVGERWFTFKIVKV